MNWQEPNAPKTGAQLRDKPEERKKKNQPYIAAKTLLKDPCLCAYWKVHKLWR